MTSLALPLWLLAIAFLWPVGRYLVRRNSRRIGRRADCGYDLTGNTSGRCPECGTALDHEHGLPGKT